MVQTADVVVVGGGVNGASIAYALASKGVRCVLVEKGAVASGASGRSSALVRMHYTNEWDARLAWASFPVFRHWSELMGGPPVFTHTGFVNVVAPAYAEHLRQERRDAAGHRRQHAGDHGGRAEGPAALRQRGRRRRGGLRAGQRLRQSRGDGRGLPPARRGAGRRGSCSGRRSRRSTAGRARCSASRRAPAASTRARSCWRRARGRRASAASSASICTRGPRPSTPWRSTRPAELAVATWSSSTTCRATTSGRRRAGSRSSACRARSGTSIPTRSAPGCRRTRRALGAQLLTHRIPAMERATLARGYRAFDGYSRDRHAILGARRRDRRPLPGDGVQRLRLQDRPGRRHVHGRADHRGPRQDGGHRGLQPAPLRRGRKRRGTVSLRDAPGPPRSAADQA